MAIGFPHAGQQRGARAPAPGSERRPCATCQPTLEQPPTPYTRLHGAASGMAFRTSARWCRALLRPNSSTPALAKKNFLASLSNSVLFVLAAPLMLMWCTSALLSARAATFTNPRLQAEHAEHVQLAVGSSAVDDARLRYITCSRRASRQRAWWRALAGQPPPRLVERGWWCKKQAWSCAGSPNDCTSCCTDIAQAVHKCACARQLRQLRRNARPPARLPACPPALLGRLSWRFPPL